MSSFGHRRWPSFGSSGSRKSDAKDAPRASRDEVQSIITRLNDADATVRRDAAGALRALALHADMKKLIVRCHGIGPLVDLCDGVESDGRGAEAAARCLWNLAVDDDNKVQIAASGAVPALVAVLASTGEERRGAREAAAGALRNLAVRPENRSLIIEGGAAPPLVALLQSADAAGSEAAARCVWNLAYESPENQAALALCIEPLVVLCGAGAPNARGAAAGALRNLLHANASNRDAASTAGAAPVLAKLLTDPEIEDAGARKHAAALLKSMAAADPNGVAAALNCDADRVVIGLEIDRRLATKPVDTMRRSTSQKTLAAMMRRLTPKSSSSKKNVVTSK